MTSAPQAGPEGTPALGEAAATGTGGAPAARAVPEATVARLAVYLRVLTEMLAEQGTDTVSSDVLAAAAGVNSAKLRKDLSHIGSSRHPWRRLRGRPAAAPRRSRRSGSRTASPSRWSASATSATRSPATAGSAVAASRSRRCSTSTRPWSAPRSTASSWTDVRRHPAHLPRARRHDRRDRHPRRRGPGCLRPAGRSGCREHPELRARPCCRYRSRWRCARSTWRWRCRSWRSTSRAGTSPRGKGSMRSTGTRW